MHRSLKRALARLAVCAVLIVLPVAASGCGAATHYFGGRIAHSLALHYAHSPQARRRVNRAYCVYTVYRALHDFTHHHAIFGALNTIQAIKNCEAGFSRNAR